MAIGWQEDLRPGVAMRAIVQQATTALIAMDAERLEELALCCADLNRDDLRREAADAAELGIAAELVPAPALGPAATSGGVRGDLDLLRCILRETRANLTVLSRLHAIRLRAAYHPPAPRSASRQQMEAGPFGVWSRGERRPDYGDN